MLEQPPRVARLLPDAIRRDVFEPAWRDLRIDLAARHGRTSLFGRAAHQVRSAAALLFLFFDCWRVALNHRRPRRPREGMMTMVWHQLFQAVGRLVREPLFAFSAVFTLALGVGTNVGVFAVVDAVLLRPLPYPDGDRLAVIEHVDIATSRTKENIAIGDYVDLAARQSSFESFGAYDVVSGTVAGLGNPFRASALLATEGTLTALRMQPIAGRSLRAADSKPNAAPVVIISHDFWQQRLGSDPTTVGRHLKISGLDFEVIGIAPAGFAFPPDSPTDLVMPLEIPVAAPAERKAAWTQGIGRLKPGVSVAAAAREFSTISDQLATEHPADNQGSRYLPLTLRDLLTGNSRVALELLLVVVGLVLLVACANAGNLWLARSIGRRREVVIRLAIGAGRRHLVAQFLAEGIVIVSAATGLGVAVAIWLARALVTAVPASVAVRGLRDVHCDGTIAAFAAAIAVGTVVAFAVISTATIRDETPAGALLITRTTDGPSARRVRSGLVMAELALAVAVLLGAGLILRSLDRLQSVDPGFQPAGVLTLRAVVPVARYPTEAARRDFYIRAMAALRAVPGVRDVGTAAVVPLTGNNWTVPFEREDRRTPAGQRPPEVGFQVATRGYFTALGIPILAGRLFTDKDVPTGPPVVVVSRSVERTFFQGDAAVGHRIVTDRGIAEIVGVVGDIRRASLADEPRADLYLSGEQLADAETSWFIKIDRSPVQMLPEVRAALTLLEPRITLTQRRTMADLVARSTEVLRFTMWLFGAFAVLALLLAGVGVYSVVSYFTRQRTREIGTRTALGATRADILRLVMYEGGVMAAGGVAIGLVVGAILVNVTPLRSLLFGTSLADPLIWIVAPSALFVCALAACYVPARRTAGLDPVRALAD